MICKKCGKDISGDCVLTGRPDVEGVCVFCWYNTNTWDSNGQLVTKDQATRGIGWFTREDLEPFRMCKNCKTLVRKSMYETGMEEYCDCQNTIMAEFDKTLWEDYELNTEFKCPNNSMVCNQEYACDACPYNEDLKYE